MLHVERFLMGQCPFRQSVSVSEIQTCIDNNMDDTGLGYKLAAQSFYWKTLKEKFKMPLNTERKMSKP